MANEAEFIAQDATKTHYVHWYDPSQGFAARNITDSTWDATENATWTKYTSAATRVGSTNRFKVSLPASGVSAASMYSFQAFEQQGGGEANTDPPVWYDYYKPSNLPANAVQVSGSSTAADNVETCFTGTITTLDALDTAQDTQHSTTQNSLTTVLARLGSWTGTGVNTILGAFKAALSKAASTPSDIGGTFDASTDSTEAIRDAGFSTLDAAGIRTAIGLGSANLDTQLADLPTVAEFEARTLVAANYFDPGADTVTVGAFNTAAKAELQTEAAEALTAYDPPTRAEATSDANSILAYVDLIDDGTSGLAKIAADVAAILVDTGTTLDAFIQAVKAKTDNLPTSPAAVGSAMTLTSGERNSVADAVLNRGASNIENTADKHSLGAVVMIATNAAVSGTTLTAKKPSDDTTFQTYTVTVDAAADPITGVS